jgi:perosamine synthetase
VRTAAIRLAALGGSPAVPPGSHRSWPEITPADRAALERVLRRGELWGPNAPEVSALQREWADYVGVRFCLVVNSGTAALHCAVVAAGVGPGDEVIVPAFSFVATPMAVLHAGAVPVFCDIDPRTHTIDPRRVEESVGERTRAIMPVHAHGLPADMDELRAIAGRHRLALIEDAAQAHGATYRGVRTGALGDGAGFSLNGSKNLSAGEGGLFVTDDEEAFVAARRLAIFGEDTPPTGPGRYRAYWSHGVGWNYRSHELTAALARSQLDRLDAHNRTAQRNAALLNAGLSDLPGLEPPHVPEDRTCVFYRYRIRIRPEELDFDGPPLELRDRLLWALQAEGVAASLWQLLPLPAQPVFRRGRFTPWSPGDRDRLAPWNPAAHPEAATLLESSIVLGTATEPLFNQPTELMERYLEAFEKVLSDRGALFRARYRPVMPWPPVPADQAGRIGSGSPRAGRPPRMSPDRSASRARGRRAPREPGAAAPP